MIYLFSIQHIHDTENATIAEIFVTGIDNKSTRNPGFAVLQCIPQHSLYFRALLFIHFYSLPFNRLPEKNYALYDLCCYIINKPKMYVIS